MLSDRRAKLCHILRDKQQFHGKGEEDNHEEAEDIDRWYYRLLLAVKVKTHLRDINEAHLRLVRPSIAKIRSWEWAIISIYIRFCSPKTIIAIMFF